MNIRVFTAVFLLFFNIISTVYAQEVDNCLTNEEMIFYELITAYRKQQGMPQIALSKSLTKVAKSHVSDLAYNHPDVGKCTMYSWSDQGKWKKCCFTDIKQNTCMWDKPSELTSYLGKGYELVTTTSAETSGHDAIQRWRNDPASSSLILNKGIWKDHDWKSIGIGILDGYLSVWVGDDKDPEGEAVLCK